MEKNKDINTLQNAALLSCYRELTTLDTKGKVTLVECTTDNKIYVKKVVDSHCYEVYHSLKNNPVKGTAKIKEIIFTSANESYHQHENNDDRMNRYDNSDSYDSVFNNDSEKIIIIEEYITGNLLSDVISNYQLSSEKITDIFVKICRSVRELHRMDPPIIHRDIKASNIIIDNGGDPILLDFDIAKNHVDSNRETDTYLLGSKGYAAPEQYGFGQSTPQTDIYALGILLNAMVQNGKVTKKLPEKPEFKKIISKCISLNPADRYKDMDELIMVMKKYGITSSGYRFPNLRNIPGFRTLNVSHIFIASIYYILAALFIIGLFKTTYQEDYALFDCIGMSIIAFDVFFLPIPIIFNYRNMWRFIPFSESKNLLLRILMFVITYALIAFILMAIYMFIAPLLPINAR